MKKKPQMFYTQKLHSIHKIAFQNFAIKKQDNNKETGIEQVSKCQNLQFASSKRQSSLVLKLKK